MDVIGKSIAYAFLRTVLRLHTLESIAQVLHSALRSLFLQNISICCSFLTPKVDEGKKYFNLSFLSLFFVSQN